MLEAVQRWLGVLLCWLHATFVVPVATFWESTVLGTWEEVVTSAVRHACQEGARIANGLSSWFLAFFNKEHRASLKASWQQNPWSSWWHQVESRPNTLNALLATMQESQGANGTRLSPSMRPTDWGASLASLVSGASRSHSSSTEQSGMPTSRPARAASLGTPLSRSPPLQSSASMKQHPPAGSGPDAAGPIRRTQTFNTYAAQEHSATRIPASGHATASNSSWWSALWGGPKGNKRRASTEAKVMGSAGRRPSVRPVMFLQQSGMGVIDAAISRAARTTGLVEDARLGLELRIALAFAAVRSTLRSLTGLSHTTASARTRPSNSHIRPSSTHFGRPGRGAAALFGASDDDLCRSSSTNSSSSRPAGYVLSVDCDVHGAGSGPILEDLHLPRLTRSKSARLDSHIDPQAVPPAAQTAHLHSSTSSSGCPRGPHTLRRATSFSGWEDALVHRQQLSAGDVIRLAGYPLQLHSVTTQDGYVLLMERIPRPAAKDTVFFMHGVLDTSLSWVSAGVTGSQAYAAWEMGYDVWLGNSRCNAPRLHQDPLKPATSPSYWRFSCNELGELDVGAQLEHIHNIKCAELEQAEVEQAGLSGATSLLAAAKLTGSRANSTCSAPATASAHRQLAAHPRKPQLTRAQGLGGSCQGGGPGCETLASSECGPASRTLSDVSSWSSWARTWFSWASSSLDTAPSAASVHDCHPGTLQPPAGQDADCTVAGGSDGSDSSHGGAQFFDAVCSAAECVGEPGPGPHPGRLTRAAVSDGDLATCRHLTQAAEAGRRDSSSPAAALPAQAVDEHHSSSAPGRLSSLLPADSTSTAGLQVSSAGSGLTDTPASLVTGSLLSSPTSAANMPVQPPPPAVLSVLAPTAAQLDAAMRSVSRQEANEGEAPTPPATPPRMPSTGSRLHALDESAATHAANTSVGGPAVDNQGHQQQGQYPGSSPQRLPAQGSSSPAVSPTPVPAVPSSQGESAAAGGSTGGSGFKRASSSSRLYSMLRMSTTLGMTHRHTHVSGGSSGGEPYRLRAVAHSLGCMSLLIHVVRSAAAGRPTRIHRLVLLTPAGFHDELPNVAKPITAVLPLLLWLFRCLTWPWWRRLPGWRPAIPLYIPTTAVRALLFKLLADLRSLPSLAELLRLGIKLLLSDDASQWDRALQMPHYGADAMPAVSLDELLHLIQCSRAGRFQLFDYGSASANRAVYGTPTPPDLAAQYWRLKELPIDLVAGIKDGIIPPANVRRHYQAMKAAGCKVSYKEFEFGHLDFTFAVKDELQTYLLRLLRK